MREQATQAQAAAVRAPRTCSADASIPLRAQRFASAAAPAPKTKATQAHLGEDLSMYYNEEARALRHLAASFSSTRAFSWQPRSLPYPPPLCGFQRSRVAARCVPLAAEAVGGAREGRGGACEQRARSAPHPPKQATFQREPRRRQVRVGSAARDLRGARLCGN